VSNCFAFPFSVFMLHSHHDARRVLYSHLWTAATTTGALGVDGAMLATLPVPRLAI
jgi:hypothetical protein